MEPGALCIRCWAFTDFISLEDFVDQNTLDTYQQNGDVEEYEALLAQQYPGEVFFFAVLSVIPTITGWWRICMRTAIPSSRSLIFNVTMQNHGGYSVAYRNFDQQIKITNMSTFYPQAERYLSLVKESDSAFQELVEYFSNVDEPTIICMFGDHFPSIEDEFYEELLGTSLDELTTEQEQLRYATPFVIWANYDIPEAEVDNISANYLSTLLMQTAGLPMTQYNKYLAVLYQSLPVINTIGYIDSEAVIMSGIQYSV